MKQFQLTASYWGVAMRRIDSSEDGVLMRLHCILLSELSEDFPVTPSETLKKIADQFVSNVCAEFGGSTTYFPISPPEHLARRNAEILAAFRAGASYPQLVKTYKLTERRIRILVEEGRKAEGRQPVKKANTDRSAQ